LFKKIEEEGEIRGRHEFYSRREKGEIIVGLGWRSGYVQAYASLAWNKRILSVELGRDIK